MLEPDVDITVDELVTAAVLGTDRRPPPEAPPGPVHDLVADSLLSDPAERLLVHLGAIAVQHLAAAAPDPPVAPLPAPMVHDRRWCPVDVVEHWDRIVEEFAVLTDEWLSLVAASPWHPPPDLAVDLLHRSRSDPDRRALVTEAVGPMAGWLIDLVPVLGRGRTARAIPVRPPPIGADEILRIVVEAVRISSPAARRTTLERVLATGAPEVLDEVADRLEGVVCGSGWLATLEHLGALARFRHRMIRRFAEPDR